MDSNDQFRMVYRWTELGLRQVQFMCRYQSSIVLLLPRPRDHCLRIHARPSNPPSRRLSLPPMCADCTAMDECEQRRVGAADLAASRGCF